MLYSRSDEMLMLGYDRELAPLRTEIEAGGVPGPLKTLVTVARSPRSWSRNTR